MSAFSNTHGARSPTVSVIAGLKKKAVWAASWWATRTIVRSASLGPELGEDLMGGALRQQAAEAPPPGRQLVGGQGARRRPRWRRRAPARRRPAPPGGDPGEGTGAGQQAERPPEGAVGLGLLLDPGLPCSGLAQLARPATRPPGARPRRPRGARSRRADPAARAAIRPPGAARSSVAPRLRSGKPSVRRLRSVHARGWNHPLSCARDQDRGRLLLVPRPLPDHHLALGLLSRRARARRRRRRGVPPGAGERPPLLRLDPPPRARPRLRRPPARDRDLRDHPVDVRRGRPDGARLRQPRHRVQDRDRRAGW